MSDKNSAPVTDKGLDVLNHVLFERDEVKDLRNIKFFVDESCVTKEALAQTAASYIANRLGGIVHTSEKLSEVLPADLTAKQFKAQLSH